MGVWVRGPNLRFESLGGVAGQMDKGFVQLHTHLRGLHQLLLAAKRQTVGLELNK